MIQTAAGEVRQRAPLAYQEVGGERREVECGYALLGRGRVGFRLGAYDRSVALVIDPVLSYSTYVRGSGDDYVNAVAVDASGNTYLVGRTTSPDFPASASAVQDRRAGSARQDSYDAFVTKLNEEGTAVVYSTYLGGYGDDEATSVAVDAAGNAYVAGHTDVMGFPVTPGAFRTTGAGGTDIFVSKLDAAGSSLVYSTFLGGSDSDTNPRVALGGGGELYVGGRTQSSDFPVTPGVFQPQPGGLSGGASEGFVSKLDANGSTLLFSSFLGGEGDDMVEGLARGLDGSVYVTGRTSSADFFADGFQGGHAGGATSYDAFVTRVDSGGSRVIHSTYLGGAGDDAGTAVAVDAEGNAYVAGLTYSASLATSPEVFRPSYTPSGTAEAASDAFVAKLTPNMGLTYFTYYGGAGNDEARAVAVDAEQNAYVVGRTSSASLPSVEGGYRATYGGGPSDGFFFELNPTCTASLYATYVGGGESDAVNGVALDGGGGVYLAGNTFSQNFPFTVGAFQVEPGEVGKADGFALKFQFGDPHYAVSGRVTNESGYGLSGVEIRVAAPDGSFWAATTDADGNYVVNDLPRGSDLTVSAMRYGFNFTPAEVTINDLRRNETVNFTGPSPLVIRGQVTDQWGNSIEVPVNITSADGSYNVTVVTYYGGGYMFVVPAGGTYTVTPGPYYDPEVTFAPPSRSVTNLQDWQFLQFEALPPLNIHGGITSEDGAVAGVTVTLSGDVSRTVVTDENGIYDFTELPRGGRYVVTPAHDLYTFAPASQEFPSMQGDMIVPPFYGELRRFRLSGRVTGAGGAPLPNVAVTLGGGSEGLRMTDANGDYVFDGLKVGRNYAVAAQRAGYSFAPAVQSINDPRADRTADFEGSHLTYALTGRVTDSADGAPLAGATVTLGGSMSSTTQTDARGNYAFAGLPSEGNYTLSATHPHYSFDPASRTFDNLLADASGDFAGTRLGRKITGRVTDGSGVAVPNATVTLGGARSATVQTDPAGNYLFDALPSGYDYSVTVAKNHYTFSPRRGSSAASAPTRPLTSRRRS